MLLHRIQHDLTYYLFYLLIWFSILPQKCKLYELKDFCPSPCCIASTWSSTWHKAGVQSISAEWMSEWMILYNPHNSPMNWAGQVLLTHFTDEKTEPWKGTLLAVVDIYCFGSAQYLFLCLLQQQPPSFRHCSPPCLHVVTISPLPCPRGGRLALAGESWGSQHHHSDWPAGWACAPGWARVLLRMPT